MILLFSLCLLFAGLLLWQEDKKHYVPAALFKALASICFVIVGFLSTKGGTVADRVMVGLILGAIADVMLNLRSVFQKKGQLIFLIGILIFLSGHIAYLTAVIPLSSKVLFEAILAAVLTAGIMAWLFTRITAKPVFKVFGVFYIGAIVFLNCVATGNCTRDPSAFTILFAIGAFLFLVSDIILILNTFGKENKLSLRIVNLTMYYVGQLLIALSLRFFAG